MSFKPGFSLFLIFIKRLFISSSLSAIRVVSSTYLRLLIFLPAILTSVHNSSSLAFCMMCFVYKLNKQDDTAVVKVKKIMGFVAGGRGKKMSKEGFLEALSFE